MTLFKSGGTFSIVGEPLRPGIYRGCWNGRQISINHLPWTLIKTSERKIGWRAVQIEISSNGAVANVTAVLTQLEKVVRVDTSAVTQKLWTPALALLKSLGTRVAKIDLNFKVLNLMVLKGNLQSVTDILGRGQYEGGYQIWAPSRVGPYYSIRVVWL